MRGLRQGSGDVRKAIVTQRPTFFAVNETHLDGDPAKPLIPWGCKEFKVLCRLDRNSHGGGLMLGCKKHILADKLDVAKYNIPRKAELVGIKWGNIHLGIIIIILLIQLRHQQCWRLYNNTKRTIQPRSVYS